MHSLVRRYIKTAIGFLGAGLAIGLWMLVRRELYGVAPGMYEISAHTHAILVGFVMMMILGVALWLFPRPPREATWYRPARVEAAYWILTLGTAARVGGELCRAADPRAVALRWLVVASGAAQVLGLGAYFAAMWPRIRAVGSAEREARGERF
jgi:heme/copper-type cytochrome/quinol oxidase subunit 1